MSNIHIVLFCCSVQLFTLISGQVGGISSKLDFGNTENESAKTDDKNIVQAVVSVRQNSNPTKSVISPKLGQNPFNFHSIASAAQRASDQVAHDFVGLSLVCVDGRCNTTDNKVTAKPGDISADIIVKVKTNVKESNSEKETVKGNEEDADIPVVLGTAGMKSGTSQQADRRWNADRNVNIHVTPTTTDQGYNYAHYNINKNVNYKPAADGYRLQIPRFEPTFNNHYFGENPPPMYVWYRQHNSVQNPNAFVPISRSHWQNNRPFTEWQKAHHHSSPSGWTQSTICTCTNPGLNWYPTTSINNKMGPL